MISYIDIGAVKDIAKDLESYSEELNEELTKLFSRLLKVPTETKEWVGNQSEKYFEKINLTTEQYYNIPRNIKKIANELNNEADELQGIFAERNKDGN